MEVRPQPTDAAALPLPEGPYPQFLLFGDSLTQQSCNQGAPFMPALQEAFIRRLDVINRGFSGYNTSQAKVVLGKFMPEPAQANIHFMTVFFGANDACLLESPRKQGVPIDIYAHNLKDILRHPQVLAHNPRLILITPPPVNEYQLEEAGKAQGYVEGQPTDHTAQNTRAYAIACKEVGQELGVTVLDLWSVMMSKVGWNEGDKLVGSKEVPRNESMESMLIDGLHFRPKAYTVLYESLMELIVQKWPDQNPASTRFRFASWTEAPI